MLTIDFKNIDKSQLANGAFDLIREIKEAKNKLNNYQNKREPMVEAELEKDLWTFKIISSGRTVKFDYNIIKNIMRFTKVQDQEHFIMAIKCWIVNTITNFSMSKARTSFNDLISSLYTTRGYDFDSLSYWEKLLDNKTIHRKKSGASQCVEKIVSDLVIVRYIDTVLEFLTYYNQEKYTPFLLMLGEICDEYQISYKNRRKIPSAISVFKFKRHIDSWIKEKIQNKNYIDTLDLIHFLPIVLWWKLCVIIPMRPSEFCLIKRDAIAPIDNKFFITFPRVKRNKNEKYKFDTFPIPSELAGLFMEYIKLTDEYGESEYMLHLQAYLQVARSKQYHSVDEFKIFDRFLMRKCLGEFYRDIIFFESNVNIEKGMKYFGLSNPYKDNFIKIDASDSIEETIKLGDLRHIAIINMMLQGYDTVEIKYLAGHISGDTQESYYSHMQFWMETEIKRLAIELHDFDSTLQLASSDEFFSIDPKVYETIEEWRNNIFISGDTNDLKHELEIGYCKDEQMRCPTFNYKHKGCYFCRHWSITETQLDNQEEVIMGDLNKIYNQIMDKVSFMRTLLKKIDTGNGMVKRDLMATSQEVKEGLGHIAKLMFMLGVEKNERK